MAPPTILNHSHHWFASQGIPIPPIPELDQKMHEIWVNYAFAGFRGNKPNEYGVRPGKVYMEG